MGKVGDQLTMANEIDRSHFVRVVTLLGLCSILILMLVYLPIPFIPIWQSEFHVTMNVADWTSSAYGFAYAIGNIFWGTLSDSVRRVRVLYIGLFMLAVMTGLVAMSPSLALLIVFRVLEGAVAASFPAVAIAYIGDVLAPRYRAIATSVVSCGFLLASICGQIYGNLMTTGRGWHAAFLWLAVAYALLGAGAAFLLPKGTRPPTQVSIASTYMRTFRLFRQIPLTLAWVATVPVLLSFIGMYSGLDALLSASYRSDTSQLVEIQLLGAPGILLSLVAGYFIRRYGGKWVFMGGLLIACFGVVMEAASHPMGLLTFASVVFVFGLSSAVPGIITLVGQLGHEARGSATAVYAFFTFIGASLGPLLETSVVASFGVRVFFLVLAGLLLLNVLLTGLGIRYPSSNRVESVKPHAQARREA
jgi:predicted MFS family arabinose efflux permease